MKERSLLYFITAVTASVLFLVSIIIRSLDWFGSYGYAVMPTMYELFIPVVLLWVGWYFQNKGFLLSASVLVAVLFGQHFNYTGVLNGDIFILSTYAPMVKTVYVLGFILLLSVTGIGFYSYLKMHISKQ
ncbi:MAG: hypothetical protein KKH01_02400 [Firmicutes bacterium]|nr:hypothetical protein [Bacillota bacterium]